MSGSGGSAARGQEPDLVIDLAANVEAPTCARNHVRDAWGHLDDSVLGDIELIVSELVTNAVRHGAPIIQLRLRADPFAVDVAVLDRGADLPPERPVPVADDSLGGRGMLLIDTLANRWGVDPLPGETGKAVWASVSREHPAQY